MNPLLQLAEYGQSYWLDNLTREMITSGDLARRVAEAGLRGVTSNPAIFHKAITGGRDYDARIAEMTLNRMSAPEIYETIVTGDVRAACDILRPVYDDCAGADGFVSLEVSPHLAHHTEASIVEARRLWQAVDRPNLMIKIPGTTAGTAAIEALLYEGINVNVTLLFSVQRYQAVAESYLRALERRLEAGKPVDRIASVASFFLSRIDTLVDQLLRQRITPAAGTQQPDPADLLGEAAVANAVIAYAAFTTDLQGDRWQALQRQGARPQRMLWASTGTKNPQYSDIKYVQPLIGPDTVNTMTLETIEAFANHGTARATLRDAAAQSHAVMETLARLGIDMQLVTEQLLNEGIQKFIDPYESLLDAIRSRRNAGEVQRAAPLLQELARKLRREVIRMTTEAGSGHPTSCMSCADLVAALFFDEMRWDPAAPEARDVDTFVLSKGHAAPVLWAALAEAGAISEDPLTLRRIDSSLEGHPTPANPWVRVATGSLGQGLAAANGIALANRLDAIDARVFCLLGDGECAEGSVWEAAQFAALNRLDGLVAIVDVNGLGQSDPTPYGHDTSVYARRFAAFGWKTLEIDGHDMRAVLGALQDSREAGPTAILARTVKGRGVSFLEGRDGWHGKPLDREQMQQALAELGETAVDFVVRPRRVAHHPPAHPAHRAPAPAAGTHADAVATRAAFGSALERLGYDNPDVVVLDGDVKNSTHTGDFAMAFPERFFESFIAEQNMAGTALGLAVCGKIPFVATFASFLSRACDFIRMAGHSQPGHLVFCGSHAGVSIGADGPSQMGLEDIAMFRAVLGSTVLYPCDAVSTEHLTRQAADIPGIVYLRTTRPKTPVIYSEGDTFRPGGSQVLRASDHDRFTLVAAGITVHEALAAYNALLNDGITVRVIDAYSIKPLDVATLTRAARETRALVTIEDHWIDGGLGDAVAAGVQAGVPVIRLAIRKEPHSGTREELLQIHGISSAAIRNQVLKLAEESQPRQSGTG